MSSLGRKGEHWVEGGRVHFTSVINIAPHLRDYTSNAHVTSKFCFTSQAKPISRVLHCLHILLAGVFMLRTFQGTFLASKHL